MKTKILLLLCAVASHIYAQNAANPSKNELRYNLNPEGTHYVKGTFLNQTWLRYNQSNPGTTINGNLAPTTTDIGLRRTRAQFFGQISDRVFFYTQFGMNNFNALSQRKSGAFFHDVVGEYQVSKNYLSLGAGLTGWGGLSRYSSPSAGTILGMDAPLFAQATSDANDQFLRKLAIYAKGKVKKVDYRFALADPFEIQTSNLFNSQISTHADFSPMPSKIQSEGYVQYAIFDEESNLTPYTTGTYLGKKKILNFGAGFIQQPKAMWRKADNGDTLHSKMQLLAVDMFLDMPLNKEKETALTLYAGYFNYNFGSGYVRNLGVMNPANGTKTGLGSFNGAGNAFPMLGTGSLLFAQGGYLLPKNVLGELGKLQAYASGTYAKINRLNDPSVLLNAGVNWLIDEHRTKISLDLQNRPVFSATDLKQTQRLNAITLQMQVFF